MTVDREQIRRDAEELLQAWTDDEGAVARHCLALLAELEQAERERDAARGLLTSAYSRIEQIDEERDSLDERAARAEARLALAAYEQEQKP